MPCHFLDRCDPPVEVLLLRLRWGLTRAKCWIDGENNEDDENCCGFSFSDDLRWVVPQLARLVFGDRFFSRCPLASNIVIAISNAKTRFNNSLQDKLYIYFKTFINNSRHQKYVNRTWRIVENSPVHWCVEMYGPPEMRSYAKNAPLLLADSTSTSLF